MAKKPGKPRVEHEWASTLRRVLFVSYADHAAVHTALHMAGTAAQDMIVAAMAEYIARHQHPACTTQCQQQVAMAGLGIGTMPQWHQEIAQQTMSAISHQADLYETVAPALLSALGSGQTPAAPEQQQVSAPETKICRSDTGDFLSDALDDC